MIKLKEQTFKTPKGIKRPFSEQAGVRCRGYSTLFQRRITDFGAEKSFERAARQIEEHYGQKVSSSAVRRITEQHGQHLQEQRDYSIGRPAQERVQQLVAETDGTMVPIVYFDPSDNADQRKTRKTCWNEARLSLVFEPGQIHPRYGAIMGSPEDVGVQLSQCALSAGMDETTQIHGVGDGASWIANQMEVTFGANATYTIDFYHLCDYLSAASKSCAVDAKAWLDKQKARMKKGELDNVMADLKLHREPETVTDENAPVRVCERYILNRTGQFDYPDAIQRGLPIGSGKVESGHRHVIQERLKISGAWWENKNVGKMLALRTTRANGNWKGYWASTMAG